MIPETLEDVLCTLQTNVVVKQFIHWYMKYKKGFDLRSSIVLALASMGYFE